MELASYFDSTDLRPQATREDIILLCKQAAHYQMAAVCVQPYRAALAHEILDKTSVNVCTVIGFPLGAGGMETKVYQAQESLRHGANELDMVINLGALKDQDDKTVKSEIEQILCLKQDYSFILKVIVETALLSQQELVDMTCLLNDIGADYIKTSTGYSSRGVSLEDIKCIAEHRAPHLKVKASGGIRSLDFALDLIEAGADRLGSSSAVAILEAYQASLEG